VGLGLLDALLGRGGLLGQPPVALGDGHPLAVVGHEALGDLLALLVVLGLVALGARQEGVLHLVAGHDDLAVLEGDLPGAVGLLLGLGAVHRATVGQQQRVGPGRRHGGVARGEREQGQQGQQSGRAHGGLPGGRHFAA
jgi:hypothetical protein